MIGRRHFLTASGAALALPGAAFAEASPRLLLFGDSLTEGYGLPPDQNLTAQLQDYLDRHDVPAHVINGGLSGDTSYGGRVRIRWSLLRHSPDAVVVEIGGNDMMLGWQAQAAEENLDVILGYAAANDRPVLLVGVHPRTGSEEWRRSWTDLWPRLAQRHKTLLLPDLYAPLEAQPEDVQPDLLLADKLHPSTQGVTLMVSVLGPKVQELLGKSKE